MIITWLSWCESVLIIMPHILYIIIIYRYVHVVIAGVDIN